MRSSPDDESGRERDPDRLVFGDRADSKPADACDVAVFGALKTLRRS